MNVDITSESYLRQADLRRAINEAGKEGSLTISVDAAGYLADDLARADAAEELRSLAADLLKGVVLQGAARAAIPIPEDVRALVRLARELDAELKTPTPWPVEKPAPEEEDD